MLNNLKFVRGAVSTKNLTPEMKHFAIENGKVRAFNGTIGLSCPIDTSLECAPLAAQFVYAVDNCRTDVTLNVTQTNRLHVHSGEFNAFVNCVELNTIPHVLPAGERIDVDGAMLLKGFEQVIKFVGDDAARPWTNGVLLRDHSMFATNNVCLVEYWLGVTLPITVNIPMKAVQEFLRIGEEPTFVQMTDSSMTFHYEGARWLRTQLLAVNWPDLRPILDRKPTTIPIPEDLFVGLRALKPFLDEYHLVYFEDGYMATHQDAQLGATYDIAGLTAQGAFTLPMLSLLEGTATVFDLTAQPTLFYGENLRGVILGRRE